MNNDLSKFVSWLHEHEANLSFKLNPPADIEAISDCEHAIGKEFPELLRELFIQFNGQAWENLNGIFYGYQFVSLEYLQEVDDEEFPSKEELLEDGLWEDLTVKSHYYYPKWMPIAHDGSGLVISLDFDPGTNGVSGQVIAHGPEMKNYVLANSFEDFIRWYVSQLEAGNYYIGEPDGIHDESSLEFKIKKGTHFSEVLNTYFG